MTQKVRKALVRAIKDLNPCADCGADGPAWRKHFDHLPQYVKLFNIAEGLRRTREYTTDDLLAEIAKCEVVCFDCHMRRTVSRSRYPDGLWPHDNPPRLPLDSTERNQSA